MSKSTARPMLLNTVSFLNVARLPMHSSFVVCCFPSAVCTVISFSLMLLLSENSLLRDHYSLLRYYSFLRHPSIILPQSLMVLPLVLLVLPSLQGRWTSQVSQHFFTGSLTSATPVRDSPHPDLLTAGCLLLAWLHNQSALTIYGFRGYTFTHYA